MLSNRGSGEVALSLYPQQGMLAFLKIICAVMHSNAVAEEAYRDVNRAYHCQSIIVLWEAGLDRFEIQKGPLNITAPLIPSNSHRCMLFALRPEDTVPPSMRLLVPMLHLSRSCQLQYLLPRP